MVREKENNRPNSGQLLCDWCYKPITLNNSLERFVCLDCYRRLVSLGMSDKEIFNPKQPRHHKI